ncbi:MAG: filamentous hemagglutinin N-terminal domain-containing protein [Rivularia sp. (in: cyanobacteria)]
MINKTNIKQLRYVKLLAILSLSVFWTVKLNRNHVFAQNNIVPDETLGNEKSRVVPFNGDNAIDTIRGGAIRDSNLFHSFQEFNVGEDRSVYFANPQGITDIFSRVTGNNPSNIFGKLGVLGDANLFLINPNGIVFGENASLDVGGSFVATTANGIEFGEQGLFSASNPEVPRLLNVNPSALFFNQVAAQPIVNKSRADAGINPSGTGVVGLRVPDGKSFLLVGGDINIDAGGIVAFGGRVDLASIAGKGEVELNQDRNNLSLNVVDTASRGNISLTNDAGVIVTAGDGGDIAIAGRNIDILGGSTLNAGILSQLGSVDAQGGDITLNATEKITINNLSEVNNDVNSDAIGNSGDINIVGKLVEINDGAEISASTDGKGNAGSINILGEDTVSVKDSENNSTFIFNNNISSEAVGDTNGINITTGSLFVNDGAQIQSLVSGEGNSGKIIINAREQVSLDGRGTNDFPSLVISRVEVGAVGNGGGVDITTNSLSMTNRAQIISATQGQGNAGNISIEAQNQVLLLDSDIITEVSEQGGVGKGGDIKINTGSLLLQDGSSLLADVENIGKAGNITINVRDRMVVEGEGLSAFANSTDIFPSQVTSTVDSNAVGEGGDITISTGTLLVNDKAFIRTDNLGQGNAGDINITAASNVSLTAGGEISADTTGEGSAGDITIDTTTLSVNDSQVSSTTFNTGNAGNLTVRASELVELSGEILRQDGTIASPGGLLAQVNQDTGKGKGGDLTIETGRLSVSNGSKVQVATFGEGDAGNLFIQADEIDIFNTSNADNRFSTGIFAGVLLDSRSVRIPKGNGGNLTIETERLNIINCGKVSADTDGIGDAGDIDIMARGQVFLDGQGSEISSSVNLGAIGDGGDIKISADSLSLTNDAAIVTSTFGTGKAGDIAVELDDRLSIDGSGSGLFAVTQYKFNVPEVSPDAGESLSTAQNLTNQNSQVNGITGSLSNNNDVDIYKISLPGNQTFSATTVNRSTNVDTRLFLFDANGRGVYSNDDENDQTRQSTLPDRHPLTPQKAGNYYLAITSYENEPLSEDGTIFGSSSFTDILGATENGGSQPLSSWNNNGTEIGTYVVSITDSSTTPAVISGGSGGNINIRAESLSITNGAQISAESRGQGAAGNININVEATLNANNGSILTSAQQSSGGAINITAKDIRLSGNSDIATNVFSGAGGGGNINLNANTIIALDDSDILSFAGDGKGGDITFNTEAFFSKPLYNPSSSTNNNANALTELDNNNRVDVNASGTVSGTISGIPDTTFIQDSLTELPENQIDTNVLVASSCIVRNNQQNGTFFVTGAGGLPINPSDAPLSNYSTGSVQSIPITSEKLPSSTTQSSWKIGDPIVEPSGVYQLPNGQIVLSRECSK